MGRGSISVVVRFGDSHHFDFNVFERMRCGGSTRPLSIFYLALIYFILIGSPFASRPDARSPFEENERQRR
jgi:hypothetical protein